MCVCVCKMANHYFINDSSDEELCYDVSDSEGEYEENLTVELRCMFKTVYKYYVKELKIQCELKHFFKKGGESCSEELRNVDVEIEFIKQKLMRYYDVSKHVKIVDAPFASHVLEVDERFMSMGQSLAITSEEMREAKRYNQYCSVHLKCLCWCKQKLFL